MITFVGKRRAWLLVAGLLGAFSAAAFASPSPRSELYFSVGNLSVPLLLGQWGSPLIGPGANPSLQSHRLERANLLNAADESDVHGIEDYLGWAVVEPEQGSWDWSIYRENAQAINGRGFQYIPFVWIHNLPRWVRDDPNYPRARCVEHGLESEALSIFSPQTLAFYDRFFARMASELTTPIELIRIGAPNDFGETSYPVGVATFAFPDRHVHPGFWVDEADARAHFALSMRTRYGNIAALNSSWGTSFASFDVLAYPSDASHKRRWLDFVNWYHEAHTDRMGAIIDIARAHFPNTDLKLSLGFPDERISYGQDISGVVKLVSQRGQQLRTPTGPGVPFFYTKRVATAARFYGLKGFSSEPQDGEATVDAIASAAFKDLTTGVTMHFDYPPNLVRADATIKAQRQQWKHRQPEIDTALFFSTTAHRLNDSRREEGFPGYPDQLLPFTQSLRDIVDYDVVDERLLTDGALSRYRVLVWPFGLVTEAAILSRIRTWVEGGGILVVGKLADVATVEGNRGAFTQVPGGSEFKLGQGTVFDANGQLDELAAIVATRRYVDSGAIPASALLPPLDRAVDGVLVSQFADGILLFNTTSATVIKSLAVPAGPWRRTYSRLANQVTLGPLEIVRLDGAINANQRGLTGLWYEPATSGQGLALEVYPDAIGDGEGLLFGGWFSYDTTAGGAATQRWYSLSGTVRNPDNAHDLTIYRVNGGDFNTGGASAAVSVGSATIAFSGCDTGTLRYRFSDGSNRAGTIDLSRATPNVSCAVSAIPPSNADFALSGFWYDPATPGQGVFLEINSAASVAVVGWYTYAANLAAAGVASQRWYTGQTAFVSGARTLTLSLFETTGGVFDAVTLPRPSSVEVGSATISFIDCRRATLNYVFQGGSSAGRAGTIPLTRVGTTPADCGAW